MTPRVFLTGEWRFLAMLNYRVDAALLEPLVPRGTMLDDWKGATYVSLVGFLFRDTRVLGIAVPRHRQFEEVNLRLYVRREGAGDTRRGVTFIREIVPRAVIAAVARVAYNEPYLSLPMRHSIGVQADDDAPAVVGYEWRQRGTVEYRVAHPSWRTWSVDTASVHGDLSGLYGAELGRALTRAPDSAFLAEGSRIEVHMPARLEL